MIDLEIVCDLCQEPGPAVEHTPGSVILIRALAKEAGWKHQPGTLNMPSQREDCGDFCPSCVASNNE